MNHDNYCKETCTVNQKPQIYSKSVFRENTISEFTIQDYSTSQPKSFLIRKKVIEWIFTINESINGQIKTFLRTVNIYERFMGKISFPLELNDINLYSAVCYYISVKFEEVEQFEINFLKVNILANKFTTKQINEAELLILRTLGFKIYNSTIETFSELLFEKIRKFDGENYQIIMKAVSYINCIVVFFDELLFNRKPSELAIITMKACFILLEYNRKLSKLDVDKLQALLGNEFVNFNESMNEISCLICQTVINDDVWSEGILSL
jgi:hypothetical protein